MAALPAVLADGADVVVSLCRMGTDEVPEGVEHHTLGLLDSTVEENPNAAFLLADLAEALAGWVDDGRRVVVHCVQAQNRTPAAAVAWLVHQGASPADATARVVEALQRPKPFLVDAAASASLLREDAP